MVTYIKYLGIDFGSSSVSVVGYEDKDKKPIIFSDPARPETCFATAMATDNEGYEVYFKSAFAANFKDYPRTKVFDSLKEDIIRGNDTANVTKYMTKLFRAIYLNKHSEGKYDFSRLEEICFGYPAYIPTCREAYCKAVKEIILNSCATVFGTSKIRITCAPEPVLAAMAYNEANKNVDNYKNSINDGDLILVVDLGGYTLDMTIVKANKDESGSVGFRPFTASESLESNRLRVKMGKQITSEICFEIYKDAKNFSVAPFVYEVDDQKCNFFNAPNTDTAPTQLKIEIETEDSAKKIAKFVLCGDQTGDSVKDDTVSVGIYSSTDNRTIAIRSSYINCVNHINEYISLNARKLNNKKISHVIFTGGTSRIEELRETIINQLNREFVEFKKDKKPSLLVDDPADGALTLTNANDLTEKEKLSSDNVVALGAAVVAAQQINVGLPGDEYVSAASDASGSSIRKDCKDCKNTLFNLLYKHSKEPYGKNPEFKKLLSDISMLFR